MENRKTEQGVIMVEATIVFPIVFFVILFLLYFGNVFYLRSKIEAVTEIMAVKGAAYYIDPMLQQVEESGSVPLKYDDIKPYRYWFGNADAQIQVREELQKKLGDVGTGLFAGMSPSVTKATASFENHLFYDTFVVEVNYAVRFPIRFIGSDNPVILNLSAKSVASAADTDEFIRNTDMLLDYYESSGVKGKVEDAIEKAKEFLGGNKKMKD